MEKLYIVIPAYNEEENIENVINDWYPIVEQYHGDGESRLVVINDGSKDGTQKILERLMSEKPMLVAITKENSGHGATVLYGYHYALRHKADYIFQTDSDGQTSPEEFHEFWEEKEKYDMVIGHRNKREDGGQRVFVTKVLKVVIRLCFHVSVTDANTPFRLMNARVLGENIHLVPDDFNLSNVIISVTQIICKDEDDVRSVGCSLYTLFCAIAACPGTSEAAMAPINALFFIVKLLVDLFCKSMKNK